MGKSKFISRIFHFCEWPLKLPRAERAETPQPKDMRQEHHLSTNTLKITVPTGTEHHQPRTQAPDHFLHLPRGAVTRRDLPIAHERHLT